MKRLIAMAAMVGAVVMLATAVSGAQAPAQDLSGRWTMKVSGGPHGEAAMALVLKQDGEKVTAQFNPGHDGDIPMSGTFVKGALAMESPANDEGSRILMKGTLKADGSMSGFMSSMMGDMTWSATRDKGK